MRAAIPILFLSAGLGVLGSPTVTAPAPAAETGSIVGTVRTQAAAALGGAVVTAANRLPAVSAPDGSYRIENVPAGRVELVARRPGYQTAVDTVTVVAGAVTRADFTLLPAGRQDELIATGMNEAIRQSRLPAAESRDAAALAGKSVNASPALPISPAQAHLGRREGWNTEGYNRIVENAWRSPLREPLSTFSTDVDAASYSNVRRFLTQGQLPPADAVRIEEMINYFRYDYPEPRGDDPVSITTELADAPWSDTHKLVMIGLQTRRIPMEELPPNNLVFLLDVSGSMTPANKLPLVKSAFRLLVDQLRPQDRVAIVVYAGAAGLVLPPTSGKDKGRILDALDRLHAGGSTAGGAGIKLAYQTAREAFLRGGNNRVILATDGDFNVGASSDSEMIRLIEAERGHGIFLTVLGFGMGNLKDGKLEQIADKGNGHYAYVDDILEARKVFVQELGATLFTVAKDVKLQIEFNPRRVQAYRLVGYENRLLANEDFNDDTKDAGELGAGHAVTALYEIVPAGVPLDVALSTVDPLRYRDGSEDRPLGSATGGRAAEWLTVKLRYKPPTSSHSLLLTHRVRSENRPSADFRWATAVAGVAMLLRDSEYKGSCDWDDLLDLAQGARGPDREGFRAEFIRLAEVARALTGSDRGERGNRGRGF